MHLFEKYTDAQTFSKIVDYENVAQMWNHSVETYPDNIAVIDGENKLTYAELDAEVAAFRTVLRNAGAAPGSLIGILCPNSAGFVKAFLAAATCALPCVLLPAHLDAMTGAFPNMDELNRASEVIRQEELALYDYYQQYIESKKK